MRLLIQAGLFLGLGAIVGLSTAAFLHFRSAAISLEKEVKNLVRDKSSIIDAELTKRISVVSGLSFLRYAAKDSEFANRMPAILQSILAVPSLAEEKFEEMKAWELPRNFVKGWSITDKDKEYILEILAIWYYLQEKVPEACSKLVRRITDGTIAAILLGILIGVIDIILQYHFESILSLLVLSIVVAGYYYCICGILGVKKITKLEELSKKLEKTEDVDHIKEISMEITRV